MGEPVGRAFVIDSEWYWRIAENATTFNAAVAVRDFLAPLARLGKDAFAITELAADGDAVRFVLETEPVTIQIEPGAPDRIAVHRFVLALNRVLASAKYAFALVTPRRYELHGVLTAIPAP